MKLNQSSILTINGGSSSIKFAMYTSEETPLLLLRGEIKGIGSANVNLNFSEGATGQKNSRPIATADYNAAANFLLHWLQETIDFHSIQAIGHRIVHGMKHTRAEFITPELLVELKSIIDYDPEHLPGEISLIELFASRYPELPQVTCFDTAFHTSMPPMAKRLAIPRRYEAKGIQRYGFHGLSYAYLLAELERIAGISAAMGKIIMSHLGSGASIAALKDGQSMDTSMGFTPASGFPMSTRSGDLDPGVASYLMQAEKLTPQAYNELINHQSGLLGISETTGDMQELLKAEATDVRAAEAIDFFCYQTKKWIGAYAAVLGGLDTVIFSGEIGEHAADVRRRICNGLQFLKIELDEIKNRNNERIISSGKSNVVVYVIKTNEELMIARQVVALLEHVEVNSKT
jgi:acetate kinase